MKNIISIKFPTPEFVIIWLLTISCSQRPVDNQKISEQKFYTSSNNRLAAEWEPALGTMVVWPLSVPHKLVIELAKDNHLFTLVENETSRMEAMKWYAEWGIDSAKATFIYAPPGIDSWWVRDWGPGAVFSPDNGMKLADGKYIYSTPATTLDCFDSLYFLYLTADNKIIKTEVDDNATVHMAKALSMDVLDLPFVNTGGNVLTDGLGTAFSTCVLTNENRFYGVPDDKFLELNKKLLGIDRYNIIPNFEKEGIQHIDCYMKLLDEERILIAEPPKDHELFEVYETIIQTELSKLKTAYGRPYTILRIKSGRYEEERLAAYTNSIIINKTIYVPLFRIKEDKDAMERWGEVMPGYSVKGFEFDFSEEPFISKEMKDHYPSGYGWNNGDALHCRTRAVWDPEMLFMTMRRIDATIDSDEPLRIYATVIDYSSKGVRMEESKLFWRLKGTEWNAIQLTKTEGENYFYADIPDQDSGAHIEYYISAASNSGRVETVPRPGALGPYSFVVVK